MKNFNTKTAAIISSLTGGLGHYCAHLAGPLSDHCNLKFITYPQVDLSGFVVKQITDSFIRKYIKWPRFDIDENNPQTIPSIHEYLNTKEIDLVNIHIATTVKRKITYFTSFVLYGKKFFNTQCVFTLHDVLPFDDHIKMNKMLKLFYSLGDHFTVGNESEKEKLIKHFSVSSSKITVIPHGIYNLFNRNLYTQTMARSYLGLPSKKQIVLFFGFLREYKGFEYLIEAARLLKKKRNDFLIYVASGLKYTPKPLIEKYLGLIQKGDLHDTFVLNLNYLDTLDLEAVFQASDVVALPYTHASQSGVMMMSFGFKKPVVITESFHDKEWVSRKAGLVAKTKDAKSIATHLETMFADPEKAKQWGKYGYTYSMKHFSWKEIGDKYYDVYQKMFKTTR